MAYGTSLAHVTCGYYIMQLSDQLLMWYCKATRAGCMFRLPYKHGKTDLELALGW